MPLQFSYSKWPTFRSESGENIKWAIGVFSLILLIGGAVYKMAPVLLGAVPLLSLAYSAWEFRAVGRNYLRHPAIFLVAVGGTLSLCIIGAAQGMLLPLVFPPEEAMWRSNIHALVISSCLCLSGAILLVALFVGVALSESRVWLGFYQTLVPRLLDRIQDGVSAYKEAAEEWENDTGIKLPLPAPRDKSANTDQSGQHG